MNTGTISGLAPSQFGYRPSGGGDTIGGRGRLAADEVRILGYPDDDNGATPYRAARLMNSSNAHFENSIFYPGDRAMVLNVLGGNVACPGVMPYQAAINTAGQLICIKTQNGGGGSFESNTTVRNLAGVALSLPSYQTIGGDNQFISDGAACTINNNPMFDYGSHLTYTSVNGGTLSLNTAYNYEAKGFLDTSITWTSRQGFHFHDAQGAGAGTTTVAGSALATQIAFDTPYLVGAANNYGIVLWDSTQTQTYSVAGNAINIGNANTFTMNAVNIALPTGLLYNPTVAFQQSNTVGSNVFCRSAATVKNVNAVAANLGPAANSFQAANTFQADGATITMGTGTDYQSNPTFGILNAGVLTATGFNQFRAQMVVNTGVTLTTRTALSIADSTGSGTVTTAIGVDIPALAAAGTNIGIRNFSSLLQKGALVGTPNVVTVTSNAGTVAVTAFTSNFTNSSAATMTITMATTGASDGQLAIVRVFDASAAAQTITWVNTENGEGTAPVLSNGSTTLPKTVIFQYNSATSKWRCIIL